MFTGSEKDCVGVRRRFIGKGGDVETAKENISTTRTIVISNLVRAIGVGDVDLNDYQVGLVVEVKLLNVLVLQGHLDVGIEIGGESRETKRRKKGILDRPPIRTGCFG